MLLILDHLQILHPHPTQRTFISRLQHPLQQRVMLSFASLRLVRPYQVVDCSKSLVKSVACMSAGLQHVGLGLWYFECYGYIVYADGGGKLTQ
jgi:hypothetical protein